MSHHSDHLLYVEVGNALSEVKGKMELSGSQNKETWDIWWVLLKPLWSYDVMSHRNNNRLQEFCINRRTARLGMEELSSLTSSNCPDF